MKNKKNSSNRMPAMMFYPGDWLKDPAVRCCSLAARGLWIDMIALMYECPQRGYLSLAKGKPLSTDQIARMVGGDSNEIELLLSELRNCGVFYLDENNIIYSKRMVGDENLREAKSKAGKKGMESRYGNLTNEQQGDNKVSNKDTTPLEYESEIEIANDSSSNYLLSRRSRSKDSAIDLVLDAIPKNRLQNPSKTRLQIRRVLDIAISNGKDEGESVELLCGRFDLYYKSEEGQGQYFKSPHKWLEEDCHLVDPSVWGSRKKKQEDSGWDSIKGID